MLPLPPTVSISYAAQKFVPAIAMSKRTSL